MTTHQTRTFLNYFLDTADAQRSGRFAFNGAPSSAPQDGTYLDIVTTAGAVHRHVYWCDDAQQWAMDGRAFRPSEVATFTHWSLSNDRPKESGT